MTLEHLFNTPEYQNWEWGLASGLRNALELVYAEQPDEIACLDAMVQTIQATRSVDAFRNHIAQIQVEAAFLHGNRSQVEFDVGGNTHRRELADLLVLASYVYKRSLCWQRVCFLQAKRASSPRGKSPVRFDIDKWQLALLRAFPAFTGISGIVRGRQFCLRNRSGMLGAYGFLNDPGDLSVFSARLVAQILGSRSSITIRDIIPSAVVEPPVVWEPVPISPRNLLQELLTRRTQARNPFTFHSPFIPSSLLPAVATITLPARPPRSALSCLGVEGFVQAWAGFYLGEVWHTGVEDRSDRELGNFVSFLVSRVHLATGTLHNTAHLLQEATDTPPEEGNSPGLQRSERSGGIAVISVIASVGKGEVSKE